MRRTRFRLKASKMWTTWACFADTKNVPREPWDYVTKEERNKIWWDDDSPAGVAVLRQAAVLWWEQTGPKRQNDTLSKRKHLFTGQWFVCDSSCLRTSSWRPRECTCVPARGSSGRGSTEPYGSCWNASASLAPPPKTTAMPSSWAASLRQISARLMWVTETWEIAGTHCDRDSASRYLTVLSFISFRPKSWKVSSWRQRAQKAR